MKKRFHACSGAALTVTAALLLALLFGCGTKPSDGNAGATGPGAGATPSPTVVSPSPSVTPTPSPSPSPESAVPVQWRDRGLFSDFYEESYAMLQSMTTAEKIGQLLLARCPQEDAVGFIKTYQPGGLVLFEADFRDETTDGVVSMLKTYQSAAKIPLILSTDEEGGTVVRISGNKNLAPQKFTSPQAVYKKGGMDAVREDTLKKSALLKKLGLNLNLAPVADVSVTPKDFIYSRSFGKPAAETGDYVETVVTAMRESGLSAALKHFPGYGSNVDTHTGISVDDRPLATFYDSDFIPFEKGIAAGAECVLVSHNIITSMEPGVPASLSPEVHRILRDKLGFTGVILTDDLSMDAVKDYAGAEGPYVAAALAGNDMLLVDDYETSYEALLAAAKSGKLPTETIDRAVFRILAWKLSSGILKS